MLTDVHFQQIRKAYLEKIAIKSVLKTAHELVFHHRRTTV